MLGSKFKQAGLITNDGGDGGGLGGQSAGSIKAELDRFEQDGANRSAMNNERHPLHKDTVTRRRALIEKLAAAGGGR